MIRSMTGFGRSQEVGSACTVSVEMNTVNRRNLEFSISLPREWQTMEGPIQTYLKDRLSRGRVHLSVVAQFEGSAKGSQWDLDTLKTSLEELGAFARAQGIEWKPDADALIRLACQSKAENALQMADDVEAFLLRLVGSATDRVISMRETEGRALKADLTQRIDAIELLHAVISRASTTSVPRYREQLMQRLTQAGLELELEDERVLKEVAIFADKCDISEELTRLGSHFDQFRECLESGSPVGRKLEFIVQEINREVNTIGSKANNYGVSREVIEAKNEIERIREQILNIE